MQTLREQGLGAKAIISSYPDKGWKLSTVEKVCSRVDRLAQPFCVNKAVACGRPATTSAGALCAVRRCKTIFSSVGRGATKSQKMSIKR